MSPPAFLQDAFAGRRRVTAWLGYGDPLFPGFGNEVLPERDCEGHRTVPPFELQTQFADWTLYGETSCGLESSETADLEAAVNSLIGEVVVSWELLDVNCLRLEFAGGKVLRVVPWDAEEGRSCAWCVCSPNHIISFSVDTDGRTVIVEKAN